jgi:isoquinoline 1-oxidoreductase alpha subunit
MLNLTLNGTTHTVDVEPEMPLLWVLRETLGLRGTKFGCGKGLCGACTVHVDGRAMRSCITPVAAVADQPIRTIEGLGTPEAPHPVQEQWIRHQVPQCGYCQPGMQMAAVSFLDQRAQAAAQAEEPPPPLTDGDIARAITNVCRCGCYARIRRAILDTAKTT